MLSAAAKCSLQPEDQAEQVSVLTSLRRLLRAKFAIYIERYANVVSDIKHVLAPMSLTGDSIKYMIFQVRMRPEHSDICVTSELLAVTQTTSKADFLQ